MKTSIAIGLAVSLLCGSAFAQSPGLGETRPAAPDAAPAAETKQAPVEERAPTDVSKPRVESDRATSRCHGLSGMLLDDCVRQERSAGTGATRPAEPATAPPPQNPR